MRNIAKKDIFEKAILFLSSHYHKSVNKKPVLLHSIRVGMMLHQAGYKEDVVVSGFLHDVIEDMSVTPKEIQAMFGKNIADIVSSVSFDTNVTGYVRRYKEQMSRAKKIGRDAFLVETADIFDNSRYFHRASKTAKIRLRRKYAYFLSQTKPYLSQEPLWIKFRTYVLSLPQK